MAVNLEPKSVIVRDTSGINVNRADTFQTKNQLVPSSLAKPPFLQSTLNVAVKDSMVVTAAAAARATAPVSNAAASDDAAEPSLISRIGDKVAKVAFAGIGLTSLATGAWGIVELVGGIGHAVANLAMLSAGAEATFSVAPLLAEGGTILAASILGAWAAFGVSNAIRFLTGNPDRVSMDLQD